MCGLNFIYSPGNSQHIEKRLIRANKKLIHRGPDQQAIRVMDSCGLGHTRLSILDLTKSTQPMSSECGRYWIVFNGEIYNFKELRNSLKSKWKFRTSGDTETILAGIVSEGESFIKKLDGMWAFVIWDNMAQKLTASRDPFGKKPLYYTTKENEIFLSSEIPSLRLLDDSRWDENPEATANYFRFGFFMPGKTIYKSINEVLPAHTLNWGPGRAITQTRYWQLPEHRNQNLSRNEVNENTKSLLNHAIEKRLLADVEVGAFLSGGIDSSLVVALASEKTTNLKTFCIRFSQEGFDESQHARLIAKKFATDHYEFSFDEINPGDITELLIDNFGQPFGDPSALPTALISHKTSKHVKVVLTGDGGDEIFSGYQRYQAQKLLELYNKAPKAITALLEKTTTFIKEPDTHHSQSVIKKLLLFIRIAQRYRQDSRYLGPEIDAERLPFPDDNWYREKTLNEFNAVQLPNIERMMKKDTEVYLPQDILFKVDRCTMAHGLEARSPFLDKSLAEFAYSIGLEHHRSLTSGKSLLKTNFPQLPDSIIHRRKQGFSIPVAHWFKHDLRDELLDLATTHSPQVNKPSLVNTLDRHLSGKVDLGLQLWAIYTYLKWKEHYDSQKANL